MIRALSDNEPLVIPMLNQLHKVDTAMIASLVAICDWHSLLGLVYADYDVPISKIILVEETGINLPMLLAGKRPCKEIKCPEYAQLLTRLFQDHGNLQVTDNFGRTCLHHAAAVGNCIALERILTAYGDTLGPVDQNQPEAQAQYEKLMFALVDAQTIGGETALMKAVASCSMPAVKMLLYFSGAPFAKNRMGKDVLSFARARDVKLLLQTYYDTLVED